MKQSKVLKATLLFLLREDEILLAMKKRGFGADKYNGVGGKVDAGETIEQAAIRECQEEIGVTPQGLKRVAKLDFAFSKKGQEPQPEWEVNVFFCRSWKGTPTETEEMAPKWFKCSDIPYDKMWEDDAYWLPVVLTGRKVHGSFAFDSNDHLVSSVVKNTP